MAAGSTATDSRQTAKAHFMKKTIIRQLHAHMLSATLFWTKDTSGNYTAERAV